MAFSKAALKASLLFSKISLHFPKLQGETGSQRTASSATQSSPWGLVRQDFALDLAGPSRLGSQRAIRDGDWKYLRIAGNEFLFDVVKDPRERANLKDRQKEVFDRLRSDWEAWNDTMLPERPRPATYGNPGNFVADHYGVTNPAPAASSVSPPTR